MFDCWMLWTTEGHLLLSRTYDGTDRKRLSKLERIAFSRTAARGDGTSAFASDEQAFGKERTLAFQRRGDVVVAVVFDGKENELATLDVLQLYLYALETLIGGTEAKRVMRQTSLARDAWDEIVVGGVVVETEFDQIVSNVRGKQR